MRNVLPFLMLGLLAAPVAAEDTVDFQSGFTIDRPARAGVETIPGVGLQVRWFGANALWLAGAASFEASADLRDPERGETLLAIGGGAGVWFDLGTRVTCLRRRPPGVRARMDLPDMCSCVLCWHSR